MRVVRVALDSPDHAVLAEAADLLRSGSLVAFPTETVYGLGAHALDERAVQRIYEAKGRPSINPLIVHVADVAAARALAADWPPAADALAALWPGPITLVVRKAPVVPDIVTAGGDTVGVRVPAHPVALALLREARIPIAAPSANLFNQVSPTTALHVARGLGERVPLVLDGGPTAVGIESTVVDVTGDVPRILRPGMVSRETIAAIVGAAAQGAVLRPGETPRSPGMLGRHYAPRAKVRLFASADRDTAIAAAHAARGTGRRVGAMTFTPLGTRVDTEIPMQREPASYARALYASLHALDDAGCELVLVESPPDGAEWTAVRDRLDRMTR